VLTVYVRYGRKKIETAAKLKRRRDEEKIRKYIRHQEQEDRKLDKLSSF